MYQPFEFLIENNSKSIYRVLFFFSIIVFIILQIIDVHLKTNASSWGIVSFEISGNIEKSSEIIASWDKKAVIFATLSIGVDYLFIFLYATTIGLGCLLTARKFKSKSRKFLYFLGSGLSLGMLIAALFDVIENYAMLRQLLGMTDSFWPKLALWCAIPKFGIVLTGIIYLILGYFHSKMTS